MMLSKHVICIYSHSYRKIFFHDIAKVQLYSYTTSNTFDTILIVYPDFLSVCSEYFCFATHVPVPYWLIFQSKSFSFLKSSPLQHSYVTFIEEECPMEQDLFFSILFPKNYPSTEYILKWSPSESNSSPIGQSNDFTC